MENIFHTSWDVLLAELITHRKSVRLLACLPLLWFYRRAFSNRGSLSRNLLWVRFRFLAIVVYLLFSIPTH